MKKTKIQCGILDVFISAVDYNKRVALCDVYIGNECIQNNWEMNIDEINGLNYENEQIEIGK